MSGDAQNKPPFVPPVSSFTGPVGELIAQRMLAPPSRPGLLANVDHFEIIRLLGGGGMGIVLLARDLANGREVAIKMVKSDLVTNQHAVHRFLKETGHLKRLLHTNIVPVEEISDRPEGPYFVMPYFEKGSLAGRIKPGQPLDTETILSISIQVAEGLSFAHRSGIIHRDLKPANILLGAAGKACLADFGLARSMFNDTIVDVESRQLEGTAPYVSPAIAAGDAEDTRCDIYSFGALLYEMLTGQPPYQGRGTKEILDQILAGPPKPITSLNPAADRGLVAVTEGCMARELRDRYADMRDVLKDLRRIQAGQPPIGLRADNTTHHASKILAVVVCLLAIALIASATWLASRKHARPVLTPATNNAQVSRIASPSNGVTNISATSNTPAPVIAQNNVPAVVTNAVSQPVAPQTNISNPVPSTNPVVVTPTPTQPVKSVEPSSQVQPIVNQLVQLSVHGLGEDILSNYTKENPPKSPLSFADLDYLQTNGVPPNIIGLLHELAPTPAVVFTNRAPTVSVNTEVPGWINTAYEKYKLHENREAISYCNKVLQLEPDNPAALCIKGIAEEALHHSAEAMTAFNTFLKLPASRTPEYASWRTYATLHLRELRGW
jgi:serine/threonine protein kinase